MLMARLSLLSHRLSTRVTRRWSMQIGHHGTIRDRNPFLFMDTTPSGDCYGERDVGETLLLGIHVPVAA